MGDGLPHRSLNAEFNEDGYALVQRDIELLIMAVNQLAQRTGQPIGAERGPAQATDIGSQTVPAIQPDPVVVTGSASVGQVPRYNGKDWTPADLGTFGDMYGANNLSELTDTPQAAANGRFVRMGWSVVTRYNTAGSFTHTFNAASKVYMAILVGGGGGGMGGLSISDGGVPGVVGYLRGGASGGAGGTIYGFDRVKAATVAVVVGAGGAGAAYPTTAGNGGASSVTEAAAIMSAGGGNGGGSGVPGVGGTPVITGTTNTGVLISGRPGVLQAVTELDGYVQTIDATTTRMLYAWGAAAVPNTQSHLASVGYYPTVAAGGSGGGCAYVVNTASSNAVGNSGIAGKVIILEA